MSERRGGLRASEGELEETGGTEDSSLDRGFSISFLFVAPRAELRERHYPWQITTLPLWCSHGTLGRLKTWLSRAHSAHKERGAAGRSLAPLTEEPFTSHRGDGDGGDGDGGALLR